MKKPDWQGLRVVKDYLSRCEWAADPQPGLTFKDLFLPFSSAAQRAAMGIAPAPKTIADVLGVQAPRFPAQETLPTDRAGRVAVLTGWLQRFPAFVLLQEEPSLKAGFQAFKRVAGRRSDDPKLLAHGRQPAARRRAAKGGGCCC
jgi:hypothetical protein